MGLSLKLVRTIVAVAIAVMVSPSHAQKEPPVVPVDVRMDAVFGRPVVFRVQPKRERPPAIVPVRLDDGRTIDGQVQWVGVRAGAAGSCAGSPWLPVPPVFEAVEPGSPGAGDGPGSWMMRLAIPLAASGQGFWLGGVRYEPNWLPDPRRLVSQGVVGRAWSSPLTEDDREDSLYRKLIEPYHEHPLHGWRYDLAMDVFTPGEEFGHREEAGPVMDLDALRAEIAQADPFDPITQDLARLERARWQVALARLWNADPTLSLPVRLRLVGAIESSGGLLPAWTIHQPALNDLLGALLDPQSNDQRRAQHTRAWLDGFDDAIAWVVDDAGRQDGVTGAFLPTIGVVNTSRRSVLAWARAADLSGPTDLTPLMPGQVHMLRGQMLASDLERPASGPGVEVQVGNWAEYLPAVGVAIPASPPGFALGPFRSQWTLDAWRAMDENRESAPPRDRATAVLLFRGPIADAGASSTTAVGPMPGRSTRQAWVLYIEARALDSEKGEDFVELWFGPYGLATSVLRVYSDGRLIDGQTGKNPPGMGVEVFRLTDRWVARLALPATAIEPGQVVKMGVLRVDGCGVRSSWPRRLLPGQREPGRIAVRLDAWSGYANR
jgi:hypothetical protein